MKLAEIEALCKQKRKEYRMEIDRKKDSVRRERRDRQDERMDRIRLEKYCHEARTCER